MSGLSPFSFLNYKSFRIYIFIVLFIFVYSPNSFPQNEGISLHGDFFSTILTYGFDKNHDHPGNFLIGGQYNYPLYSIFELNGGFDFLWVELYGNINNVNKQAEVFIPYIFGGVALNFDQWRIFGKIGVSLDKSVNNIGSGKGWTSSIMNFNMGSLQFGIKFPIYNALSLSTSAGYYFGDRINIDSKSILFSTINFGLSYNLFRTEVVQPAVENVVDEYKDRFYAVQTENKGLYKQIIDLHDRIKALESIPVVKVDTVLTPVPEKIPIISVSVDSINNVYNLHLGKSLNLKNFANKNGLKEVGKIILKEYNDIASSFKGLQSGIYLVCTTSDISAFNKGRSDFPRIKFRADSSLKNLIIIDIDIKTTEMFNKIKLQIK
jgi:hypothetical protein